MELGWRQFFMGYNVTYGVVRTAGVLPYGIEVRAEKAGEIETTRCYHLSTDLAQIRALADFLYRAQATPDTVQDIVEDWIYSNSPKEEK